MATTAPSPARSLRSERASEERSRHVPDEDDVARWAAIYEGLPGDLREGLDELGREIGKGSPRR